MKLIAVFNRKTSALVGFAIKPEFGTPTTLVPGLAHKWNFTTLAYETCKYWNTVDCDLFYECWDVTVW